MLAKLPAKPVAAGDAAARLSQLRLEKRALAAAVDAKRRSERIDLAIHAPRLLGETDPE